MRALTRMVQKQECARVMVYGMVVYYNAYQIKMDKMVYIIVSLCKLGLVVYGQ